MELHSLLTPQQVATFLGVTVATLAIWRCKNRYPLPYLKIGRAVRYRTEDVINFTKTQLLSLKESK